MRNRLKKICGALAILAAMACADCVHPARAAEQGSVRVAAAGDLKFTMGEIVEAFRRERPAVEVSVTYGSSGNFYAQLSNRAPFDIFFSADVDYPRRLVRQGLALADSEFLYGVGRLVVWVPWISPIEVEKLGIQALLSPSVRRIAIANPRHAPYGRAAEAAMKSLGVYDRTKDRLVLGDSVMQTAQFVESGGAEAGIKNRNRAGNESDETEEIRWVQDCPQGGGSQNKGDQDHPEAPKSADPCGYLRGSRNGLFQTAGRDCGIERINHVYRARK